MGKNPVALALDGLLSLPRWHAQRWQRRDEALWTFGAWDGLRYSDNSRAVYEYVLEHRPDIRAVWMTRSEEVQRRLEREGKPVARFDTPEGRRLQRRAACFFLTKGPQDSDPRSMNGCRLIWLWHGMPLKQIGNDAMAFIRPNTAWKRLKTAVRRVVAPWEFLTGVTLSTAPFFTPFLQSAFALPRAMVWEVGLPRNDRFFRTDVTERFLLGLDERFGQPLKVLYMPTHRDQATREGHPFDPFALAGFDAARLEAVLEARNMVLLYKGHFFDAANGGLAHARRILTVTDDDYDDLYTFVKDVDVLLTDYSSIYFDFLLCRKPIILFPFDEADYVARSRPFYFDYALMEGRRVTSWPELCDVLQAGDYAVPTEEAVRRFHLHPDGQTCRRLLQRLGRNPQA